MQVGNLVKCHFKGMGIVIKKDDPCNIITIPLTRFYVQWVNHEATWATAMNLEVVCK